ncbi:MULTISPECIES: DUF7835 family putative zinc beta-ribbon protein [Haloferax]|uniref:DUF7835 domain-containing protein n=2 Tax=Haloferax TaxID=2251 RepID=A0A6A8GIB0_9EURY|nr:MULTISPECIES: hypothetical protein [Haloferax]KAB1194412.1 hypothetical protein Hfx1148_13505 [Haloferax sp. CBA1148]KTG07856.1 hypothetical protein AUR66_04655 [Haloferax profundi]MRX22978.1 hypothetical protein [Haloferax litoreum]
MSKSKSSPRNNEFVEECPSCETRTSHDVSIEIKTESRKRENRQFSREPYRVTQCTRCGDKRSQRMNDA